MEIGNNLWENVSTFKQKGLKLTTLAIIGGGIAGRSLIFSLAKSGILFEKIFLFYSEPFAPACSLNSTAIVAARGVSTGLSPLGDLLKVSFDQFKEHFEQDRPSGVTEVSQFSGAVSKLEQFKKRYPDGVESLAAGPVKLKQKMYLAHEGAYMIDPGTYLQWLMDQAARLPLEIKSDYVTSINQDSKIHIETLNGVSISVDHAVLCTGAQSGMWKSLFPGQKLASSKPIQGAYLEFKNLTLGKESFSLTLEGDNLIYDAQRGRLLIGSTTEEHGLLLADQAELKNIYNQMKSRVDLSLPEFEEALIRVGLREKASKREPYLIREGNFWALGGLYKNGYSAGLHMARQLTKKLEQIF